MEAGNAVQATRSGGINWSRRHAIAAMLAGVRGLFGDTPTDAPVRLAISDSLVTDVNINDARAAMLTWVKRMMSDLNVTVDLNPRVFDTTEEIVRRARTGQLDSVALNVLEYRLAAEYLDPNQIVAESSNTGPVQYVLLAKRKSGIERLADLRGRRVATLMAPKMCVASAWLSSQLEEAHLGPEEQFFGAVTSETKPARIVLPVFFGQIDACLTSKQSFDTMCELNPQVAKDLLVIASSPAMVVTFYIFHKNFNAVTRDKFIKVYADLPSSAAGRQLATLFQFDQLVIKDAGCLAPALALLEAAERNQGRQGPRGRKG